MGARLCCEAGEVSPLVINAIVRSDIKDVADIEKEDLTMMFPGSMSDAPTGWDSSVFSCGVGIIDEQHCALFQIAANLQFISDQFIDNAQRPNAMTEEGAKLEVTEVLQYLVRYVNRHFITEEMLFAEHLGAKCSELVVQRQEHRLFTEYITQVPQLRKYSLSKPHCSDGNFISILDFEVKFSIETLSRHSPVSNGNYDNNLRVTIIRVLGYVRKWLIKHISEHDQPEIRSFAHGLTLDFNGHLITLNRNITSIDGQKSKWNPAEFGTSVPILDHQLMDIFQLLANAEALCTSQVPKPQILMPSGTNSGTDGTVEVTSTIHILLRHFEAHLIEYSQLCEELSTEYGVNNVDWSRLKNNRFLLSLQVKEKRKLYRKSPSPQIISEIRDLV